MLFLIWGGFTMLGQNVGIGTATPASSAILELSSANQGFLMTRVGLLNTSDVTTVPVPVEGLLVYNTNTIDDVTPGFYYWDGSKWVRLLNTQSDDWTLLGNAGTNPATNFVGTTDNQPLAFRTNNTEKMRISATGNVGIGTTNPQFRLHLENDGMIYARGAFLTGSVIPSGNKGVAFTWYPRKAALLGGLCTGNQWDDANIGGFSIILGYNNSVPGSYSTASGGVRHINSGYASVIAGGWENRVLGGAQYGTIAGGYRDTVGERYASVGGGANNRASGRYSTVSGGENNKALALTSTIGGGTNNRIPDAGNHYWATISGGGYNLIDGLGPCVIGGGGGNQVIGNGWMGVIAGGDRNIIDGANHSVIAGGQLNEIRAMTTGTVNFIGGGANNLIQGAAYSVICGGDSNTIYLEPGGSGVNVIIGGRFNRARGWYSTVLGGGSNYANGGYVWIAGVGMQTTAASVKSFIFGYSTPTTFTADHDFLIGPAGDTMHLAVNMLNPLFAFQLPNSTEDEVGRARANAWTTYSDKRVKSDIKDIMQASEKILRMRPVHYLHHSSRFVEGELKVFSEGEYMYGFLAQELIDVLPEAVAKPENEKEGLWGVNYDLIVPVVVKALQEQIRKQKDLQTQMNANMEQLKSENRELKKRLENLEKIISLQAEK